MTDSEFDECLGVESSDDGLSAGNGAPQSARQRRLKLIPFDCDHLPRIDWPHGNQRVQSFEGWAVPQPDGRKVLVQAFHQEYIYGAALLGGLMPPAEYMLQAITRAEKLHPFEALSPVILPPALFSGRRTYTSQGREEHDDWISLPRVCCTALLFSSTYARDPAQVFSSALVIWFQDHFGMPGEQVESQLAQLNWSAIASDWCP